ncbi:MAG: NAD(P)-binding domain-containing protein [Chthoniobacteraceae bacterium]
MARKSKLNVGVIGLGIIGSRIATNLRAAGFQVYVWNRTPKPAPNFLASPAEVAGLCEVIQLVVADSTALFETINAMGSALTPKHTVICNATVGADATIEAARMVEGYGAKFLDAPFTGSKEAAEKAQLLYYIGGSDDVFKRVEPVLKATSKSIVKIGEIGQAATVKIATNMIAAAITQTLVEACAIVQRSGVDLNVLPKALEQHGVRSGLLDAKLPKIIASDYDTHFSVKHMFKDVQLAIQAANNFDIDIPATTATAGVLYASINQGWADLDYSSIAKFYEIPGKEPEPAAVEPYEEPAVEEAPVDAQSPEESSTDAEPVSGEILPLKEEAIPVKTEEAPQAKAEPVEMSRRPLPPIKKEKSRSWFSSRRED